MTRFQGTYLPADATRQVLNNEAVLGTRRWSVSAETKEHLVNIVSGASNKQLNWVEHKSSHLTCPQGDRLCLLCVRQPKQKSTIR